MLTRPKIEFQNMLSYCILAGTLLELYLIHTKMKYAIKSYNKQYKLIKLGYGFLGFTFLYYLNYNFSKYCSWRYQIFELGKRMYFESITDTRNLEFKYLLRQKSNKK